MDIKDLLFNPTRFTIRDVKKMISAGSLNWNQVSSVLKEDVMLYVKKTLSNKCSLTSIGSLGTTEKSNMVFVWGAREAGKTALIGSIFSMPGFRPVCEYDYQQVVLRLRYDNLLKIFQEGKLQEVPSSECDSSIEMLHTIYKPHFLGRSYPISFVEINLNQMNDKNAWNSSIDWDSLTSMLTNSLGHIHLFCLDCSQDAEVAIQETLERQVRHFNVVLDKLENLGLMNTANAIYVVVMKADLIKAPIPYLDNAAQTLVTSSLSSFWQKIRNICYAKHIYNAQPLTCSIGDFALKDLARINIEYSKRIFSENILKKCLPRKCFVERIFDFKKWWIKWVILPIVVVVIIYGGYRTYNSLADSPIATVKPFDYGAWFYKELLIFNNTKYEEVRIDFHRLRNDLMTERTLRTDAAQAVITDSLGQACDSALITIFAPILQQAVIDFFNSNNWSSQTTTIMHLKWDLKPIIGNKYLRANQNTLFRIRQKDLYDLQAVNRIIVKSKNCKSIADVNDVKRNHSKWKRFPFTNDTQLKIELNNIMHNAYNSCANYYCSEVDNKLRLYNNEISHINRRKYKSFNDRKNDVNNAKIKLKNNTNLYVQKIDELLDGMDYSDIKSKLQSKEKQITDITGTIIYGKNSIFHF